jgi:hypothetical protein
MRLKYGNKITVVDGIKFRSKGEAGRYQELKLLEKAGRITVLRLQVKHELIVNRKVVGTYTSDFEYWEGGSYIVEDFKGVKTALFTLKWNILKAMQDSSLVVFRITGKASNRKCGIPRRTSASKRPAKV